MSRFTRSQHQDGAPHPKGSVTRVFCDEVAVGEPYQIQGDAQFRNDIENSLELLAKNRLQEAEEQALAIVTQARAEAQQKAAEMLEKANAQSKAMITQAQSQVDAVRDSAHEEGFKAGFQEGYTDAANQVEQETVSLLQGVHALVEKAYEAEQQVLANFEQNAAALITHITTTILRREITDTPETMLAMVSHAIASLYISGKVKVVVNSQLIQSLREFSLNTEAMIEGLSRFEFIPDPQLDLTQVYIIGEAGCFDLSPEAQIGQVMPPIRKALSFPRPEPEPEASLTTLEELIPAELTELANEPPDAPEDPTMAASEPIAAQNSVSPEPEIIPDDTANESAPLEPESLAEPYLFEELALPLESPEEPATEPEA